MTHCTTQHNPFIEAILIATIIIAFIGLLTVIFHLETNGKQLTTTGKIISKTGQIYLKTGTTIHTKLQNLTIKAEDN